MISIFNSLIHCFSEDFSACVQALTVSIEEKMEQLGELKVVRTSVAGGKSQKKIIKKGVKLSNTSYFVC